MAKKFGVDSEQSKSLNELFANLVDRNPASIDKFGKLRACVACSTQHPAGPQQEVQGNREAVWETMLLAQHKLTSMCVSTRHAPAANTLQHIATHTLQHTATHLLQHTATKPHVPAAARSRRER